MEALTEISALGVSVALDDFGTGHSSLGLLRTTPVDVLKVDKSFVDGITGSTEEAVIATAMIQIAQGLHLGAVAEGVETAGAGAAAARAWATSWRRATTSPSRCRRPRWARCSPARRTGSARPSEVEPAAQRRRAPSYAALAAAKRSAPQRARRSLSSPPNVSALSSRPTRSPSVAYPVANDP